MHRQVCSRKMMSMVMAAILILTAPIALMAQDQPEAGSQKKVLLDRIDFGNSYILGQSIKSGAVYLMHRKQSEIEGMLEVRKHYRKEIMEDYALEKTAMTSNEQKPQTDDGRK